MRLEDIRLESHLQFEHEGDPILLLVDGQYGVRAFSRKRDGKLLHFERTSENPLLFRDQSGDTWNSEGELQTGEAGAGSLRQHLRPMRGYLTE